MAALASILSCGCCKPSKIEPAINIPKFDGKKRKCTDIPFLAAFGLWWLGNLLILAMALPGSEPYSLLYGRDYRGVVCGSKNSVCNREKLGLCSQCAGMEGTSGEASCNAVKSEDECTGYDGTWTEATAGTGEPGDPAYLRAPEKGTCGKYTAYPRIDRDVQTGLQSGLTLPDDFNEFQFYGVCVHECPRSYTHVCDSAEHTFLG